MELEEHADFKIIFIARLDYQLYIVGVEGRFNKLLLFCYILIYDQDLLLFLLYIFTYDALTTSEPNQIHSLQEMACQLPVYICAFIYL
jgi:hypothetical protein